MEPDPKWELALLATVQAFCQRLLSDQLRGELPCPAVLAPEALTSTDDPSATVQQMHVWIQVLDMAISPAMLRVGMPPELDAEVAEALLRYFARLRADSRSNRDKADLVATFLFRHPRVPGQWESHGVGLDGSTPLPPFEIALLEILSDSDAPALPEEQILLLREFEPLLNQANRCQDFSTLMDSGIVSRVRELKASLGKSIYHPAALATLAPYNAAFGERFQTLFSVATSEIRAFAREFQNKGGSIVGNVDGVDVTVDHIAALNEDELLQLDYAEALEKFRRVSRLKKDLQRRPPERQSYRLPLSSHPGHGFAVASAAAAATAPAPQRCYVPAAITQQALAVEEAKLRRVEEAIRTFVRVANPKFRQIVPMRYFNLTLSPAEVEISIANDLDRPGPKSDAARQILRMIALNARMSTEMEELKRVPRGSTIWKFHADSLAVLIDLAKRVPEIVARLTSGLNQSPTDQERGLTMQASLEKLLAGIEGAGKIFAQ